MKLFDEPPVEALARVRGRQAERGGHPRLWPEGLQGVVRGSAAVSSGHEGILPRRKQFRKILENLCQQEDIGLLKFNVQVDRIRLLLNFLA